MDASLKQVMAVKAMNCQNALTANGMKAYIVETGKEACALVSSMIQDNEQVCDGGSMTLQESGIMDMLHSRTIQFHSHSDTLMSRAESDAEARKAFSADTFLMSSNAISEQGEIFNIDGHGNRLSAMIFGPKQVIIVVGWNKIVKDEAEAWERIRSIAAPANSTRLHKQTPCVHVGTCQDCHSKERICSSHVKFNYDLEDRIRVIIIKEDYGY